MGSFDRFSDKAGLNYQGNVNYLTLSSPFDFQSNATLEIPTFRSLPKDQKAHTSEMITWMNNQMDIHLATLVLFTSKQQMKAVKEGIDEKFSGMILMQGDYSKQKIIKTHKDRIDQGQGSIVFGVASFSEGVDFPGDYLKHLIIAKLPFSVPDSPVFHALSEWLESVGRNPFLEVAVPDASIKLIQSVGRLIRSESDSGKVSILDRRLITKRYGQQLLDDLPPMRQLFESNY